MHRNKTLENRNTAQAMIATAVKPPPHHAISLDHVRDDPLPLLPPNMPRAAKKKKRDTQKKKTPLSSAPPRTTHYSTIQYAVSESAHHFQNPIRHRHRRAESESDPGADQLTPPPFAFFTYMYVYGNQNRGGGKKKKNTEPQDKEDYAHKSCSTVLYM